MQILGLFLQSPLCGALVLLLWLRCGAHAAQRLEFLRNIADSFIVPFSKLHPVSGIKAASRRVYLSARVLRGSAFLAYSFRGLCGAFYKFTFSPLVETAGAERLAIGLCLLETIGHRLFVFSHFGWH